MVNDEIGFGKSVYIRMTNVLKKPGKPIIFKNVSCVFLILEVTNRRHGKQFFPPGKRGRHWGRR